ncbi:peptidoglycan DD-metalloendopeptidase family protein [Planococcus sp. N028]|uniref:Peptidoglycan DD-metalloendopeptidase family protein n=1 Tax=Planococcus shixiaomingii TaxID=3058393 RepID=A0ABT8N395_9BACL|nr:M23 family metallopeptidase [Planococcus sp. N028]MDN7242368.1 peptidoglycan DD-metalloendopeptidase family protein [Planococcus sp. N028]
MKLKSKWMLSGISSVLALTIFLPTAANADKLSELEQQKREAQQQQSELNSGINEKSEKMTQNASTLEELSKKIDKLNTKIQDTETKINDVQSKIDQTVAEIDELRKSIVELERKIAEREELLQERARAIQLSGGSVDYVDVLLGANNFGDFIDRFSAVNTLIEADRDIMREQAEDKKLLAEQKAAVETKLAEQEDRRAELVGLKSSLDSQKQEQAGLVKELEAEQQRLQEEKATLEEQRNDSIEVSSKLEKEIAQEQERLAEIARKAEEERQRKLAAERKAAQERAAAERAEAERKAAAEIAAAQNEADRKAAERRAAEERAAAQKKEASSNSVTPASASSSANSPAPAAAPAATVAPAASSSGFITPASGRYTSKFGWRNIGAGQEFHQGVDIANGVGTTIMASASGYVSFAGSMGGYGNVIILTHSINGQTHATVYAHLSSIGVSKGQAVSQGQRIGGMGNTGRSFGSHLHFEIHVGPWNGSRSNAVNPASYVSL